MHPAAEQQQPRVLDPTGGEHHQSCSNEAAGAVLALDLDSVHPAGILVGSQLDRRRMQQQGHVRRAHQPVVVAVEVVAPTLEQRGLHVAES